MLRNLILISLVVPSVAGAGMSSYVCETTYAYALAQNGRLEIDDAYSNHLRREAFSVDRDSGRIASSFHTNHSPRVLWNPKTGDGGYYRVMDFGVSEVNAFASLLVIKDGVESSDKPFIWHWDDMVFSGTCK